MTKEFVFANVPESVQMLINGSIEAVNLSNNHSYDYWDDGLAITQQTLEEAGILWSNQHQVAIYEVRGIKIGMFGIDMIGNGDTAETAYPLIDELREAGEGYRIVGELTNTDRIMNDTFWIGVYPGMTDEMIDYMIKTIKEALNQ